MIGTGKSKRGIIASRAALGFALAVGMIASAGVVSSPAVAAKKKDKAPKISPSKGFVAVAGPAQTAINGAAAGDAEAIAQARAQLDQAIAAIENDDDRFMAGSLALNLAGKAQDAALQRKGVQMMLASGKADAELAPRLYTAGGQLAYQAQDYPEAQKYLQMAIDSGVTDGNVRVLLAESYFGAGNTAQGLSVLKSSIASEKAAGNLAPESWYRRGLSNAYKSQNLDDTVDFATMMVRDYPSNQNWGIAATFVRELGVFGSKETLDLMRLMGRTNSYAEERDYVEYVQAADPRRLPGEVLEVLDAGIASGKLNANDTFVADAKRQASGRVADDKASLAGYARDAAKPGASVATVTGAADALLSYGQSAEAEKLYTIALDKPGVDQAEALTRLGIAQINQGKYAEAKSNLAKITGKRQSIAKLWSAYADYKSSPAPAQAPAPAGAE